MYEKGVKWVFLMFVLMVIVNMVVGNIVLWVGVKGICIVIVIVCVSGMNLIGEVFCNIKYGYLDVIFVGGIEVMICEMGIVGFVVLIVFLELIDFNCGLILFDENWNGFVMGEGVGVLVFEFLEYV